MKFLSTDEEKIKAIKQLNSQISNLENLLQNVDEPKKPEIYRELRDLFSEKRKTCESMFSPQNIYLYESPRKLAFFKEICNFERYLKSIESSQEIKFNNFLELAVFEYEYFYVENLDFPPNYSYLKLELLDIYKASLELIKRNLERSIDAIKKYIQHNNLDPFQYFNLLGDLHLQIYLLIKNQGHIRLDIAEDNFNMALNYYRRHTGLTTIEKRYISVKRHLPILMEFLDELRITNIYNVREKIEALEKIKPI